MLVFLHFNLISKKIKAYLGCFPAGDNNELLTDGLTMEQVTAFRHVRPYNISTGQRYLVNHPNMTRTMCYDNCKSYGFPYAGLNDGYFFLFNISKKLCHYYYHYYYFRSWCGCGFELNTGSAFAKAEDSKCFLKCEGNQQETCGAYDYFSVLSSR